MYSTLELFVKITNSDSQSFPVVVLLLLKCGKRMIKRNSESGTVIERTGVSCSSLLAMMISLPLSQSHKGQRSILLVHQTQLKTSCCHVYSSCIFYFMFVWHICLFLLLEFPRTHLAKIQAKHQRLERAPNLQKRWRNVGNCWKGHIMDYFGLFSMSKRGTPAGCTIKSLILKLFPS